MKLSKLFKTDIDCMVTGLCIDSRKAEKGNIFFCIKGYETDGHKYVDSAIDNGASVIVHESKIDEKRQGVIYFRVEDTVSELNRIVNLFYGEPSHKLEIFGVTGTNGKSTITNIINQIYGSIKPCGYIGTISIDTGRDMKAPDLTTPDAITTHKNLKTMVDNGIKAAALEVSSHGLAMGRVDSVDFDYAVFTNLTLDHLDFHKTMDDYLEAKCSLFRKLKPKAIAVINKDDSAYAKVAEACNCKYVSYSLDQDGDYMAKDIIFSPNATEFTLVHNGENYFVRTNLAAKYNVYNLLAAIAVMHQAGMDLTDILRQAEHINRIPGRMEVIDEGQPFKVIIDYAHTPDGFEKLFYYVNKIKEENSRIIAVFGAAGKRDKSKRSIFGELASRYCDKIIITDQDHRDEDPKSIFDEIKRGICDADFQYIENRRMAIEYAIRNADRQDIVLILGKGDEDFMYGPFGREPWLGDNNVAKEAIREIMYETYGNC